jgi:hypothetical protein
LGIGEAVVAVATVEAGVSRCLARLHPAEKGVEGALYPLYYVLQDLAVDFAVLRQLGFDAGMFCFLLVVTDGDAAHPPCFPAFLDSSIVDMAAEHNDTIKHPLLFGSGLEFVREGFA